MKLRIMIAATALAVCATGSLSAQAPRVGKMDRTSLVVAYYRSPSWAKQIQAKRAEQEQAKAANNAARAAELETWGQSSQELAHRQLAGEAPITNILEALAPAFPAIAQRAGVSIIVVDLPYAAQGVETVDVTEYILDWLEVDQKTRTMVNDIRKSGGAPTPAR
jgi:hypothetical protein